MMIVYVMTWLYHGALVLVDVGLRQWRQFCVRFRTSLNTPKSPLSKFSGHKVLAAHHDIAFVYLLNTMAYCNLHCIEPFAKDLVYNGMACILTRWEVNGRRSWYLEKVAAQVIGSGITVGEAWSEPQQPCATDTRAHSIVLLPLHNLFFVAAT